MCEESRSKVFNFYEFGNDVDAILSVTIPQVLGEGYGMFVWPSAPVLAQYVWHLRDLLTGKRFLELGAGTALPGVLAAKLGGDVILSDSSRYPQCLENCRQSCLVNGLADIPVVAISWGVINAELMELPSLDIVLASDCFYDKSDFESVLVTAAYLLKKNPGAEMWCSYQERSASRSLEHLLRKWCLKCCHVPLQLFGADCPNMADQQLPGVHTIHMLIISRQDPEPSDYDQAMT